VDSEFDDSLPSQSEIEKNYFKYVGDAIKLNSRWSEKRNVPLLGDDNSTRAEVEKFYDFWYDFQSWREFSYLDEEDKEKGQDREERRWIEKQNKAIRIKRKKEEMSRIRSLVDLAYNNDPRIVKFKKEEKEKKLATKRAKQTAIQMQKAEEERLQREAILAKQKAEEAEQKRIEVIQKEREQQKRALKKEKKNFRDMVKSNNYYSEDDTEKLKHMEGVEKICEMLKTIELQELNNELKVKGREEFVKVLKEIEDKLEQEKLAMVSGNVTTNNNIPNNPGLKLFDKKQLWTKDNIQLLIKAVNLFPAGTIQRWEVIANFINMHGTDLQDHKFYAKEVLNKAKDLQHTDFSKSELKAEANQNAFQSFEKQKKDLKKVDEAEISVNLDGDESKNNKIQKKKAEKVLNGNSRESNSNETSQMNGHDEKIEKKKPTQATEVPQPSQESKTWTTEEQALLEQAIKTYPVSTPDRWDRIAECVKGRTKKDCLRRVKELVDLVNAKRDAQKVK
jgi:DnaJ homolog subfamily C member 2